jgi:tetratricopeptide (TPR) repeat protein
MVLTREGPLVRWLILAAAWAFVTVLANWHSSTMRDYVALLDAAGSSTPENTTPLRRPIPGAFSDSHAWVRYALAAQEGGPWQLRSTDTDNAPRGRELHWNSSFVHLISLAGRIEHNRTGVALPRATENALAWFNLPLLFACIVIFSTWATVRAGAGAGVVVALGIVGLRSFYDGFAPNYVDHHGVLTASVFGLMLGAMFMGAGWWRLRAPGGQLLPESAKMARRAAVGSALSGAFGMWFSAASVIPAIAIVGIGGLASAVCFGRKARAEGAQFDPGAWRLWGRVGAIASVVFYALEYAPAHLGMRLEVNHPLHALAWWGGAELIALLGAWHLDREKGRPRVAQWVLPLLAVSATPIAIIVGGSAVFVVRDPFVGELRHTVSEGMSFRAAAQIYGEAYTARYLINFVAIAAAVMALIITRRDRVCLGFVGLVTFAFVILSCWEIRWWLATSAPVLCLLVAMLAAVTANRRPWTSWLIVLGVMAVVLPAGAIDGARVLGRNVAAKRVDALDVLEPIYRDIAATVRASQASGDIVLLSSPDGSTGIGYYGRFKTIGTLYWENTEGLKAAAAIYCAERDEDAREMMRARGITHVAMISKANYLEHYFRLLRPEARPQDIEKTFGHRLLIQNAVPLWLRAIPYRVPGNLAVPDVSVLLLQVVPEQNELDAKWNLATAQVALGASDKAEPNFQRAIALAPAEKRAELYKSAGDQAYQARAHAVAIRLYRGGLALANEPSYAGNLAWVLATTPDNALRNGREALALVEPVARAAPQDAGLLNTFAAALAENGRFGDAVVVASQALNLVRNAGAPPHIVALLQQRVEIYRAGRPWRE